MLKRDVGELKESVARMDSTLHRVVVEQARARGDIEWLKENMVTRSELRGHTDMIMSRFDALTGKLDGMVYGSAKNLVRLDDHEKRITALEEKRA